MRKLILDFYIVFCKRHAKIDPHSPGLFGYLTVSLFVFIFLINVLCVGSIILKQKINFSHGKGINILVAIAFLGLGYYLFFNVFKFPKYHPGMHVSPKKIRWAWGIFISNFILFFFLALLRKKLQG